MAKTALEKWLAEQKRLKDYAARRPNRDDNLRCWPVLVTERIEHVIWVEGETHDQALHAASYNTYELTSNNSITSADMEVKKPDDSWDWDQVYDESCHTYRGLNCDAHVQTQRQWIKDLDLDCQTATAENEDRDGVAPDQRATCVGCRRWREEGHEDSVWHRIRTGEAAREQQEAVA